ncbi:MAG: FAD-dependent monooxygenase [Endozoicomonas sp.]
MSSISEYKEHFDVLIVGAGMVGTAIACGLGSEGIRVALFDQSELTALPVNELPGLRVSALSSASENILKNLGAWSHMKTMRMTPYRRMAVWEKLHTPWGTELSSRTNRVMFNASKIGHDQLGYIVENRVTQLGLLASAKACSNITFFCPAIIDRIQTSEAKPEIQLANGQRFSGDLLIGADGAHSIVRKSAGIGIKQRDYEQQCFVATVEIVGGCQDITWQAFTPTGPEAFLPLPDVNGKSYASIVWYHQPEKVRELLSFSDESLINELTNTLLPSASNSCLVE